jgi:predicted dehydrogenase
MTHASSRRHFIRAAAAGVSAPFILPSRIWGAETSPNARIRMGFVGMGTQARGLLSKFLQYPEVQVVAVCDVDTTRRTDTKQTVDQKYSNTDCKSFNDFREITENPDIDAVCIATPDHWHAFITISALTHGKDVYCEKPLTHNIHEAVTVTKVARDNKRVLQTGSMQRSMSEFRIASELVRNGVIGKITNIGIDIGDPAVPNHNPEEAMEPGLDWDRWCGPGPLAPYSSVLSPRGRHKNFPQWRMTREYGGGMITDWGAHHIDIAQWGLGMDENGPVEIIAPENWNDPHARGAKLVYANGTLLEHKKAEDGMGGASFFGTGGEVHVNRGKFCLILEGKTVHKFWDKENDKGTSLDREVVLTEREFLADAKVKLYKSKDQLADFLACVKSRKKPVCDVGIGASSAIACHLMNQAYYHGGTQKWNPETHEYISGGDPKWLTRDYRGEWKV